MIHDMVQQRLGTMTALQYELANDNEDDTPPPPPPPRIFLLKGTCIHIVLGFLDDCSRTRAAASSRFFRHEAPLIVPARPTTDRQQHDESNYSFTTADLTCKTEHTQYTQRDLYEDDDSDHDSYDENSILDEQDVQVEDRPPSPPCDHIPSPPPIMDEFVLNVPPGRLGVRLDNLPDECKGTFVALVMQDSPLVGRVHQGDIIITVNGIDVSQMHTYEILEVFQRFFHMERIITVRRLPTRDTCCYKQNGNKALHDAHLEQKEIIIVSDIQTKSSFSTIDIEEEVRSQILPTDSESELSDDAHLDLNNFEDDISTDPTVDADIKTDDLNPYTFGETSSVPRSLSEKDREDCSVALLTAERNNCDMESPFDEVHQKLESPPPDHTVGCYQSISDEASIVSVLTPTEELLPEEVKEIPDYLGQFADAALFGDTPKVFSDLMKEIIGSAKYAAKFVVTEKNNNPIDDQGPIKIGDNYYTHSEALLKWKKVREKLSDPSANIPPEKIQRKLEKAAMEAAVLMAETKTFDLEATKMGQNLYFREQKSTSTIPNVKGEVLQESKVATSPSRTSYISKNDTMNSAILSIDELISRFSLFGVPDPHYVDSDDEVRECDKAKVVSVAKSEAPQVVSWPPNNSRFEMLDMEDPDYDSEEDSDVRLKPITIVRTLSTSTNESRSAKNPSPTGSLASSSSTPIAGSTTRNDEAALTISSKCSKATDCSTEETKCSVSQQISEDPPEGKSCNSLPIISTVSPRLINPSTPTTPKCSNIKSLPQVSATKERPDIIAENESLSGSSSSASESFELQRIPMRDANCRFVSGGKSKVGADSVIGSQYGTEIILKPQKVIHARKPRTLASHNMEIKSSLPKKQPQKEMLAPRIIDMNSYSPQRHFNSSSPTKNPRVSVVTPKKRTKPALITNLPMIPKGKINIKTSLPVKLKFGMKKS